jgi:hypothetical protein
VGGVMRCVLRLSVLRLSRTTSCTAVACFTFVALHLTLFCFFWFVCCIVLRRAFFVVCCGVLHLALYKQIRPDSGLDCRTTTTVYMQTFVDDYCSRMKTYI